MIKFKSARCFFTVWLGVALGLAGCTPGVPFGRADEIRGGSMQGYSAGEIQQNNAIRLSFWNTRMAGTGTATLKKQILTPEGDPVVNYLIVRNGTVELVVDSRKDPWGPSGVRTYRIDKIAIGYLDAEDRFHEGTDSPAGVQLLIRYALPRGEEWSF